MSKSGEMFLTLFDDFWSFLTWPLSAGGFCGPLRIVIHWTQDVEMGLPVLHSMHLTLRSWLLGTDPISGLLPDVGKRIKQVSASTRKQLKNSRETGKVPKSQYFTYFGAIFPYPDGPNSIFRPFFPFRAGMGSVPGNQDHKSNPVLLLHVPAKRSCTMPSNFVRQCRLVCFFCSFVSFGAEHQPALDKREVHRMSLSLALTASCNMHVLALLAQERDHERLRKELHWEHLLLKSAQKCWEQFEGECPKTAPRSVLRHGESPRIPQKHFLGHFLSTPSQFAICTPRALMGELLASTEQKAHREWHAPLLDLGDQFLSSAGVERTCALPMRVPNPSPILDRNSSTTGSDILSSFETLFACTEADF